MISALTWKYFKLNISLGQLFFALPFVLSQDKEHFIVHPYGKSKTFLVLSWLIFFIVYIGYGVYTDLPYLHKNAEITGDAIFRSVIVTILLIILILLWNILRRPDDFIQFVNAWVFVYRHYGGMFAC